MRSSIKCESDELRVIYTARDIDSINAAVRNGFRPLVKKIVPSKDIGTKYAICQHKRTGEVHVLSDFRSYGCGKDYEKVIDWSWHYPYFFESPFAAYLVPSDIETGERVILHDLIEDIRLEVWNQGDSVRVASCEAIWNGEDFDIQFNVSDFPTPIVG